MCNLHQIEYLLEIDRTVKSQLSEYRGIQATSNDLCDADSCLVENLTDFIFVFSLFFKWIKKFGMWIFFMVDERLVSFWTKRLF